MTEVPSDNPREAIMEFLISGGRTMNILNHLEQCCTCENYVGGVCGFNGFEMEETDDCFQHIPKVPVRNYLFEAGFNRIE